MSRCHAGSTVILRGIGSMIIKVPLMRRGSTLAPVRMFGRWFAVTWVRRISPATRSERTTTGAFG